MEPAGTGLASILLVGGVVILFLSHLQAVAFAGLCLASGVGGLFAARNKYNLPDEAEPVEYE